jgi:hypothetical protein
MSSGYSIAIWEGRGSVHWMKSQADDTTAYAYHVYTSSHLGHPRPASHHQATCCWCLSMDSPSRAICIHGKLFMRHFVEHLEHVSLGTFAQQMFSPCGCRLPLGVDRQGCGTREAGGRRRRCSRRARAQQGAHPPFET